MFICNYFKRNKQRTEINENIIIDLQENNQTDVNENQIEVHQPLVLENTSSTDIIPEKEDDRQEKYIEFNVDKEFINNDCIICLNTINLYENVIMIDCGHKYHKECALIWFQKKKICPECDFNL